MDFRGDEDALRLWREAGADVEGERVRFSTGLLRSILKTAPSAFVQHARNPQRSLRIGGESVVLAPAYGSPFVQDLEGGRRYGTLADFENFVKLAYAIPWLHHSGGTVCEPVDIPVNKRHLDMVAAHLQVLRQAVHGLGDGRGAGRGFDRHGADRLRRATSSTRIASSWATSTPTRRSSSTER